MNILKWLKKMIARKKISSVRPQDLDEVPSRLTDEVCCDELFAFAKARKSELDCVGSLITGYNLAAQNHFSMRTNMFL